MSSFTTTPNYMINTLTKSSSVVEVKNGQLGLSEIGSVGVGSTYTTGQALWTLFPDKPTRYFITADNNSVNLIILLPLTSASATLPATSAHDGCILLIYNNGTTKSLVIQNNGGTALMTITPGNYAEFIAYTGVGNNWVIMNPLNGNGTVTSVSVVSANGLAGTVATSTTTPAITLSTTIGGQHH